MPKPNDDITPTIAALQQRLCDRWSALHDNPDTTTASVFRYRLTNAHPSNQRILPGPMHIHAQLNADRTTKRRPPQTIRSVTPAFQPSDFNFNRIQPDELLFDHCFRIGADSAVVSFLINNSPLTVNHTIVCPNRAANRPQILNATSVAVAVQLLRDFDRGWQIGYNSPGALASVNHLHMHLLQMPTDGADGRRLLHRLEPLSEASGIYRIDGDGKTPVVVDGFAFRWHDDDAVPIGAFAERVMRLIDYLCQRQIPHNVLFERMSTDDDVMVFVFPRAASTLAKTFESFNVAFCELSGYVPMGSAEEFAAITEADVVAKIRGVQGKVCVEICADVRALYG